MVINVVQGKLPELESLCSIFNRDNVTLQKRNAAELLRLMLNTGRILEASDLAVEYIHAVMGSGKIEHFGLQSFLTARDPPVWLPFNTLEVLLYELKEASEENSIFSEVSHNFSFVQIYFYIEYIDRRVNNNSRAIRNYRKH